MHQFIVSNKGGAWREATPARKPIYRGVTNLFIGTQRLVRAERLALAYF